MNALLTLALVARCGRRRSGNAAVMATPGSQRGALRARLVGIGSAVPPTKVSNSQLEGVVETSDEWIAKRTGIRSRNLLAPGMGLSDLASTAAERALKAAGVDPSEVDLVILATSSPYAAHAHTQSLPEREADARARKARHAGSRAFDFSRFRRDDLFGDAAGVAVAVGATDAVAFDLTAACSGFLFAVNTASQFLHNGAYNTAVVIGADALSRWVDWGDRNTCVLFGDGAGAAVLRRAAEGEESGVLGYEMHSNGAGRTRSHTPCLPVPRLTHVSHLSAGRS